MTDWPPLIADLPVTGHLDEICTTLKNSPSRFMVLTAETGAGKSTAVPVALLRAFSGKILMLEPRRLAALAVARRVAEILGEEPGQTAGYLMRLDRKLSGTTRLTVMTEAILTNRLLEDPALEGVSVVVIVEFHERSVHADLALCFLKEAVSLRVDLFVLVMSATVQAQKTAAYLGTQEQPAPVCDVAGRLFPVQVRYEPALSPAQAVLQELAASKAGSILVFLPGIADIRRTEAELTAAKAAEQADICILHSSISMDEQRKILSPPRPGEKRRVILSSAIAETSLTVPDVSVVIDSGLMRLNRMNVRSGMETLVTERESRFSAQQRTGRAGRTGPGQCIRLWNEHEVLPEATAPEILRSDLASVVLQCADWGITDRKALDWFDEPPQTAWEASRRLLTDLSCLDGQGAITDLGRAALQMGLSPRLACAALAGGAACILPYSEFERAPAAQQRRFLDDCERRRERCLQQFRTGDGRGKALAEPLLAGYPDRVAHRCSSQDGGRYDGNRTNGVLYQFPSGRVASLTAADGHGDRNKGTDVPEWILAPDVDAGEKQGRIYSWKELSDDCIAGFLAGRTHEATSCRFVGVDTSKIRKVRAFCYGKIELSRTILKADAGDYGAALCSLVREKGIAALPLSDAAQSFLLRAKFYRQHTKDAGTEADLSADLRDRVSDWLLPFITGNSLTPETVLNALRYALDGQAVDAAVPDSLILPNGKRCPVRYEEIAGPAAAEAGTEAKAVRPVMEVIIQRLFGCFQTPAVMGVPVLLRLLSPARRPLQVTDDLAGFWSGSWKEICKEMKGRYPKHNWDYTVAENE
ncbi:MAG: ATP-dependent helicase HrpB [Treponema sp.]|nr:ATP-dependent helicase HrpB [Treponema sp.]